MRRFALLGLLAAACGGAPEPCPSVAGETWSLQEHSRTGACSASPETITFDADGGQAGRAWSQIGCAVTIDAGSFVYALERDGGELAGTITSVCAASDVLPDGGCASAACLIDVTGAQGGP